MAIQRTARLAIDLDVLVNPLRTQLKPIQAEICSGLLTQVSLDTLDDRRGHLGRLRLAAPTRQRFLVGLAGPNDAPQLSTNRRRRYVHRRRDALLIVPGFLQRVNLVSLMLGQLVKKRLRRELRLKWPGKYTSWPFLCQLPKRLHLQVEFKKELKASFDWYFCATTRRGLLEHEIFSLVAALESLYKRKYLNRYEKEEKPQTREFLDKDEKEKNFYQKDRLTILFKKEEPFRDFFDGDDDVKSFIDRIVCFRNNIAHGDNSPINDGNLEKYVKDLRNKLGALYKLYLLHSICGIKGESLKKFVCENDRLRHQLGK